MKKKIAIIDSNEARLEIAAFVIREAGYEALEVVSGRDDAVASVEGFSPDRILLGDVSSEISLSLSRFKESIVSMGNHPHPRMFRNADSLFTQASRHELFNILT